MLSKLAKNMYCIFIFYSTEGGNNNLRMSDIEVSKVGGTGGGGYTDCIIVKTLSGT